MEPRTNAAPGRARRRSRSRAGAGAALLAALALLTPRERERRDVGRLEQPRPRGHRDERADQRTGAGPDARRIEAVRRRPVHQRGRHRRGRPGRRLERQRLGGSRRRADQRVGQRDRRRWHEGLRGRSVRQRRGRRERGQPGGLGRDWVARGRRHEHHRPVWALTIVGGQLIVGGGFRDVNGIAAADGVAAFGLRAAAGPRSPTPAATSRGPSSRSPPDGAGGAWVGGYFADLTGSRPPTTSPTGPAARPGPTSAASANGTVRALAASGSGVIVAATSRTPARSAKPTRSRGSTARRGLPSGRRASSAMAPRASTRWRSTGRGRSRPAAFLNAGGNPRADGVAIFNGTTWSNLGTNAAGTGGPATSPRVAAVVGRLAYVGGLDTRIGGGARNVRASHRSGCASPMPRSGRRGASSAATSTTRPAAGRACPRGAARRDGDLHDLGRQRRRRRRLDHAQGAGLRGRLHGHLDARHDRDLGRGGRGHVHDPEPGTRRPGHHHAPGARRRGGPGLAGRDRGC